MKKRLTILGLGLSFAMVAGVSASQIPACNQDVESPACQYYLEGVVEGALMYKPNSMGQRLESNDYESRALKYRSGKRFQQANRTYCESRIPDREVLVSGLKEAFVAGNINNEAELTGVVFSLMDCQRLR